MSYVGDELWSQKGLNKILCGRIGSTEWISKMWTNFCLSLDASPCSHVINLAAAHVRARVCFRVWSVKQQSSWSMTLCILIRSGERVIEHALTPLSRTFNEKVVTRCRGVFIKGGCNHCISTGNAVLIIKLCRQKCSQCWFCLTDFNRWIWKMCRLCPRSCPAINV